MGLSLVTKPTTEPVTLSEAKQHLRVDHNVEDGLIAGYVFAAREWVETQIGPMMTQTWDYTRQGIWPTYRGIYAIPLPMRPIQSVTWVKYVDDNGVTQTLTASPVSSIYTTHLSGPRPFIAQAYDASWPSVRNVPDGITVRFVAGYGSNPGDIPNPLRAAMLLLIGHQYENREQVVIGTISSELPFGIEALISPYRWSAVN